VNNACDAAPAQTGWVRIETHKEGMAVVVRCIDSGPGIDVKHYARLMEPFFTTNGVGEGMGLSLSIGYPLAQKNHGALRFVPGAAHTTFEVTLAAGDA